MGLGPFGRLFRTEVGASGQGTIETGFLGESREVKEQEPKLKLDAGISSEKAENSPNRQSGDFTLAAGDFEKHGEAAYGVFDTVNEKVLGVEAGEYTKDYFQNRLNSFFEKTLGDNPAQKFSDKVKNLFPGSAKYISEKLNAAKGHKTTAAVLGLFKDKIANKAEAVVAHVGDSSVYHLSENNLKLLTPNKHLVEAPHPVNPNKVVVKFDRIISSASTMGAGGRARPDVTEIIDVKPGDAFLLATDGALAGKSEHEIIAMLSAPKPAQEIAKDFTVKSEKNLNEDRAAVVIKVALEEAKQKLKVQAELPKKTEQQPSFFERNRELLDNVTARKRVLFGAFTEVKKMVVAGVAERIERMQQASRQTVVNVRESVENAKQSRQNKSDRAVTSTLSANIEQQLVNSSVLNPLEMPSQTAEEPEAKETPKEPADIEVKTEPFEIKKEAEKPAVQRQLWKRVWKKIENTDWKEVALAGASGSLVRIGAKAALDTAGLGINIAVGGMAGAASAGVREYLQQRKLLSQRTERLVEYITNPENVDPQKRLGAENTKLLGGLVEKKLRGEKMSAKDLIIYFQVDSAEATKISNAESSFRREILEKVEKLKIDKKKLVKSVIKGAAAGALGATIAGEFLAFGSEHGWFGIPDKTRVMFTEIYKSLGLQSEVRLVVLESPVPVIKLEKALESPQFVEGYKKAIKQKTYQAAFEKVESLTVAARNLVHDYLVNENLLESVSQNSGLSTEQMVYAEDYLRRRMAELGYAPSQNFAASGELVAEAVEKAKGLTAAQVENLKHILSLEHKLGKAVKEFLPNLQENNFANRNNDFISPLKNPVQAAELVKEMSK